MAAGAPLRFLGGALGAWTAVRVAMLWPADLPAPLLEVAPAFAETRPLPGAVVTASAPPSTAASPSLDAARPKHASLIGGPSPTVASGGAETGPRLEPAPSIGASMPPTAGVIAAPGEEPASPVERPTLATSRLRLDTWLVARPGGGDSLAFGQLGASQGGARLTYALDEGSRLALSGRVSAPRRGPGAELGLGVDLRPTRLPVHLLVEQRFRLDGGGARPAATVIAGGSAALPARARLDAYGQAGAVARRGGFVDAAALVTRPVLERGAARVEVGAGAWGAAQRRVSRLDLGPSLALVAPAGGHAVRLQLDYRFRVAGQARPGSGPALTLGSSF